MEGIENKVAKSALVTLDFDDYIDKSSVIFFDLKPFLFQEMILREKDFRLAMKEHHWEKYQDKPVVIGCSVDVIIPTWAFMLVTSKLISVTKKIRQGHIVDVEKFAIDEAVEKIARENWEEKKVVIKGCGGLESRDYAYTELSKILIPLVDSLMYGEPCSTVPIYKKRK